ncbi:tetratricopeptide repeat protein [Methylobacterium persicinum]|uniref:Tetratricopeptide (TPR) repeat protein n=1 Tax=Methylobacterium persicinum TaxID=374426 RepID=A0ABU0HP84_9HYPH|nr:tetratricopeptide repeat protein [Methylobacterium persicinum]MDQ0444138.1 tetratricopeptide (TPR) repeat protein [Methylobacterium persicinum]
MRAIVRVLALALCGSLPAALILCTDALADAAQDCRTGSPDLRLGGCSRLLQEARTPRQRAIALDGRCWANNDRNAFAEALMDCNSAISADAQYPYSYHNRGIAYAGLNNPSAAINEFNRAIAMRPNFFNTLLNRAKAYLSLGNTAAAIRDYEDVLRLKPDNEEARSALATLRAATPSQMGSSAANSLCGAPGCN